jgi:hypothetical protein
MLTQMLQAMLQQQATSGMRSCFAVHAANLYMRIKMAKQYSEMIDARQEMAGPAWRAGNSGP